MKHLLHFFSIILLCLTISSCGGTTYWTYTNIERPTYINHVTHIPVWIDSNFTGTQVEEIKAALNEWNYALNGQIVLQMKMKRDLGIDKQYHEYPDSFSSWTAGQQLVKEAEESNLGWVIFNLNSQSSHLDKDTPPRALAFVTGIDEHFVIVIGDRFATRSLKDVLMHEFAHLLGAMHVNTPSLEYPFYSSKQYSCIDKITAAQVANVRGLDLDHLNYCITPGFM